MPSRRQRAGRTGLTFAQSAAGSERPPCEPSPPGWRATSLRSQHADGLCGWPTLLGPGTRRQAARVAAATSLCLWCAAGRAGRLQLPWMPSARSRLQWALDGLPASPLCAVNSGCCCCVPRQSPQCVRRPRGSNHEPGRQQNQCSWPGRCGGCACNPRSRARAVLDCTRRPVAIDCRALPPLTQASPPPHTQNSAGLGRLTSGIETSQRGCASCE